MEVMLLNRYLPARDKWTRVCWCGSPGNAQSVAVTGVRRVRCFQIRSQYVASSAPEHVTSATLPGALAAGEDIRTALDRRVLFTYKLTSTSTCK